MIVFPTRARAEWARKIYYIRCFNLTMLSYIETFRMCMKQSENTIKCSDWLCIDSGNGRFLSRRKQFQSFMLSVYLLRVSYFRDSSVLTICKWLEIELFWMRTRELLMSNDFSLYFAYLFKWKIWNLILRCSFHFIDKNIFGIDSQMFIKTLNSMFRPFASTIWWLHCEFLPNRA